MKKLFLFIAAVMCAASINFVQADPVIPRETDGYLHYDDGVPYATMTNTKFWGVEFQAGAFEGVLTEVMVYTEDAAKYEGGTLTMHISSSTGSIATRTDRYHQVIDPDENEGWQYIDMETPLQFAENENCWILLEYSGNATSIATVSRNTEFVGVNWRIYDDAWVNVDYTTFMIRALFASAQAQDLEANDITTTSARLTWEGNAESYDIILTPDHIIRNVSGTEYTLTDLLPETNYDVTVAPYGAIDEGGSIIIPSEYLATTSFTTLPGPIDPTVETDGWVYYDTGIKAANIGIGDNLIYWGIMIPGGTVEATHLTKVSAYAPRYGDLTVYIYQGGETPAEGALLHQQDISWEDIGSFQEAEMTPVVSIDPSQDLWIVLGNTGHINQPAVYCNIENAHHARWICTSDATGNYAWHNIQELYPNHCQLAWMIRGLFSSETGIEEVLHQKSTINNQKLMIDGQLFILRDGKIFNAQGARVR